MILINFSHPITAEQKNQIEILSGKGITQIIDLPVDFDNEHKFTQQVKNLIEHLPLSSEELQSVPFLINPPAYNFITAILLANLHGLMGKFPSIIRLRPLSNSLIPSFEVAEIINLNTVREEARRSRSKGNPTE